MYRITESPTHATFTLQKVRRKSSFAEIGVDYTLPLFYALLAFLKKGVNQMGVFQKYSHKNVNN
jgi:hypothetical protein